MLLSLAAGLLCSDGGQIVDKEDEAWIRVRLKTLIDLRISWALAWCWRNPYLGKTVWVLERSVNSSEVFYEIKDSRGLVVLPEWIEHFLPDESVPPSSML